MSEQALYAAVYAEPEADAPRRVLADYLQAKGDPRGEFIALQLLESPTPEQRERVRELQERHAERWAAQLCPLLEAPVFVRGFVCRARVRGQTFAELYAACRAEPGGAGWSTLEALELVRAGGHHHILQPRGPASHGAWASLLRRLACPCFEPGQTIFSDFERSYLGVDVGGGRYADVSLWRCRSCAQAWIHYLLEFEELTGAGRHFRGPIEERQVAQLSLSSAIELLEQLPEYLCGGSYFGRQRWSSAPPALS